MNDIDLKDYNLVNLHSLLGDTKTVQAICYVWNLKHREDHVRLSHEDRCTIYITGKCSNVNELLEVCKYLTSGGIDVQHFKTIITLEV